MQFLAHNANDGSTNVGRMPDWYKDVQAAKYANMSLMDWEELPLYYRNRYIGAINAESEAQVELKKFNDRKNKPP